MHYATIASTLYANEVVYLTALYEIGLFYWPILRAVLRKPCVRAFLSYIELYQSLLHKSTANIHVIKRFRCICINIFKRSVTIIAKCKAKCIPIYYYYYDYYYHYYYSYVSNNQAENVSSKGIISAISTIQHKMYSKFDCCISMCTLRESSKPLHYIISSLW